jgi:hypothetical protein
VGSACIVHWHSHAALIYRFGDLHDGCNLTLNPGLLNAPYHRHLLGRNGWQLNHVQIAAAGGHSAHCPCSPARCIVRQRLSQSAGGGRLGCESRRCCGSVATCAGPGTQVPGKQRVRYRTRGFVCRGCVLGRRTRAHHGPLIRLASWHRSRTTFSATAFRFCEERVGHAE